MSDLSVISPHYLEVHPELEGKKATVLQQIPHPRSFKRLTMDGRVEVEEAFTGALTIVSGLNADYFVMPYGVSHTPRLSKGYHTDNCQTRVINIKTNEPRNLQFSTRTGKWSTLEKVCERIMTVWNARKNPTEKVLFLFALNGSKQFCGLAEMSGPWEADAVVDGWVDESNGSGNVGYVDIR